MRTCGACGFENAEEDKPCALCGASAVAALTLSAELATLETKPRGGPLQRPPAGAPAVYGGRYEVVAELGQGGMGRVLRVRDREDGRELALKVLHPTADPQPERLDRFRREIAVLAKMEHPAIPRIHGWGSEGPDLFFVSDLVPGVDLKLEIQRRGALPVPEACTVVATVADALASTHARGIVHRDVKPNNIMIAPDGSVRLLDFGLARGMGIDMATLTRTGTIIGTPGYMSPEQFDGQDVDERTDIYSLGVVLFEVLTGRLPFTGKSPIAVAMKHKAEPPPLLRSLRADLPAWLERLVLRCLEKAPEERLQRMTELSAELKRPRSAVRPQKRRLPSGDVVLEDESAVTEWALVLQARHEKLGWSQGMALGFEERFYRLDAIEAPAASGTGWTYRFQPWTEGEVFRRLVDYAHDCAARTAPPREGLGAKLSRWISGKGGS